MITVQGPNDVTIQFPDGTDPATIDGVMRGLAGGRQQPNMVGDIVKSGVAGVGRGVIGTLGAVGDLQRYARAGADWIDPEGKFFTKTSDPAQYAPSSADIQRGVEGYTGKFYEPQTTAGEYARTVGEFAPGAAIPGGIARRLVGGVALPAVASEGAGQATKGTAGELWARLVAGLAGGVAGGMRAPTVGAGARSRRAISESLTPESATRLRELGPEAFLLEANPTATQLAQGVSQRPGAAAERIRQAVTQRHEAAPARLQSDVRTELGPPVAPSRVEARITKAQRDLGPEYLTAAQSARGKVYFKPLIAHIDREIKVERGGPQAALQKAKDYLTYGGRDVVSVEEALNVRQALDDLAGQLESRQKTNALRLIGEVRKAVDGMIGTAAPAVKQVDARFAQLAREREALSRGQTVLRSGPEATRPTDLARDRATMTPAQRAALRMGTRADIERTLGTAIFDVNAIRSAVKSEGKWNHQKLAQIFGEAEANAVMSAVDREVAFRRAYDQLVANSQTAPRLAAEQATRIGGPGGATPESIVGGATMIATGGEPFTAAGAAAATHGGRQLVDAALAGGQRALDRALAETLEHHPI